MTISDFADRKIVTACEAEVAGGLNYLNFGKPFVHHGHRIIGARVIDDHRGKGTISLSLERCNGSGKKIIGVEVYDDNYNVRCVSLIWIARRNSRILPHERQRHRAISGRAMPQGNRATIVRPTFILTPLSISERR